MGVHGEEHAVAVTREAMAATISSTLGSDTNGNNIDRDDLQWPRSAILTMNGSNGLGSGSDDLTFTLQEAPDDGSGSPGTWSDTSTTIQVTNSSKRATVEIDLTGLERHLRLQLDVSDSGQSLGSDVDVVSEFVFFGMKVVPQS